MSKRNITVSKTNFRSGKSSFDKGTGVVRLSFSSDAEILRHDRKTREAYYEVLDHSERGMDKSRLSAGTSLCFNHDHDILLGRNTFVGVEKGRGYVNSKISEADDVKSYRTKIEEGILCDTSVGYELLDGGEEVGERGGVPIVKFRWLPYEVSMVTIPADTSVGMGRSADQDGAEEITLEISVTTKEIIDSPTKTDTRTITDMKITPGVRKYLEADNGGNATTGSAAATVDLAAEQKTWQATERKRVKDINDYVGAFKIDAMKKKVADLGRKAIEDGTSMHDFEKSVLSNWNEARSQDVEDAPERSHIEVIGERAGKPGSRQSIGAQFVNLKEFRDCKGHLEKGRTIGMDTGISILGARGKAALAQRAGFTSSDLSAVNVQIQQAVIGLGMQRLTIMDMIAPGSTGAASIIYPRENSFGTLDGVAYDAATTGIMPKAGMVGERGLKPKWDPDLTTEVANVKKVAVVTDVPDEFLADFPAAMSYIDERLPYMVDTRTEEQILYGDGTGNNLKGIFTNSGVQTRAITLTDDSTKAASLRQGLTDISVGSMFEPDGYAFHPYDWETAQLLKDTNGRFLAGGPYYVPYTNGVFMELHTFWGKPVVVSTAVHYGNPVAGAFKLGAQYFMREGMRIEMTNSNKDNFERNMITVRAEHRLALATYRPVAFLEFTGFPARG